MTDDQEPSTTDATDAKAAVVATTGTNPAGRENREDSGLCPATDEATPTDWEISPYSLDFAVAKSIRYHAKLRRFFNRLHQVCLAISALTASSAVATLAAADGVQQIALWLSGLVALVTTVDLVVGFSECAQVHEGLMRRFSDLRVRLVNNPAPSVSELRAFMADRLEIEKDELTARVVLNLICHNEEMVARKFSRENEAKIGWLSRKCAYFIDLPPSDPRCRIQEGYSVSATG